MVLSYYLYKYPYKIAWHVLSLAGRTPEVVFYLREPSDYPICQSVQKHLPPIPIVATKRTRRFLAGIGVPAGRLPSFPGAVIMFRHEAHKFPEEKIVKISMNHGVYRFKKFTHPRNYNAFDCYMMSSAREVELGKALGIRSGVAVGAPKLDVLLDGPRLAEFRTRIGGELNLDANRNTVLFSATWDRSGMSAIDRWIDDIESLTAAFNVLVTVHPWTAETYKLRLRRMPQVHFVEEPDIAPYLSLADLLVGDASSIIAEFCLLDRPIVTFAVEDDTRMGPDTLEILESISTRIADFPQLAAAIRHGLDHPAERSEARRAAVAKMFHRPDGQAGARAAALIRRWVPSLDR